jgi:AraC-like DNA-binding protein
MSFRIRLYRWPENDDRLIIVGLGRIESEAGTRGIPEAGENLYRAVEAIFEGMPASTVDVEFLESARNIVLELLKEGAPQLSRLADAFGLRPRTLERRLRKAGIDFTKLVDETRRRLAIELLRDPQNKLTDIALRLGYSEVSAFNRAFKRWTHSTPRSFRRVNFPSRGR